MGCAVSRLCLDQPNIQIEEPIFCMPSIRLCAPGKDCTNFADVGDKIVVYVDFTPNWRPCRLRNVRIVGLERVQAAVAMAMPEQDQVDHHRHKHEIMVAGKIAELELVHPAVPDSTDYKAVVRLPSIKRGGYTEGACIPIRLPYCDVTNNQEYAEATEAGIQKQYQVYFQPLWNQLKSHNERTMIYTSMTRSSSMLNTVGYGSTLSRRGVPQGGTDAPDGEHVTSVDIEANDSEQERQRLLPNLPAKRYWPDSWQMRCWRPCCDGILRSNRPIPQCIAAFFVSPLTNVTGLSLHYQLYLVEIFHTRFWTKLAHYLFMPLVVLTMLTFFAQFRFGVDCYTTDNISIMIPNGAAVLATIFFVWYLIWGIIQRTPFMGIFMVVPLFIMYILANVYFQLAVKNTWKIQHTNYPTEYCWNNTSLHQYLHFYNGFDLMVWYFNPVIWAAVMSSFQALSHIFEPKIPPRVNQTAHWMSCLDMFRKYGCTKTLWLLLCQSIFGAIDEFIASPRLLPLLILRVCYTMGYQRKEWKWMKKLVKKCQEYGDPALDYIGTGGSQWVPENSTLTLKDTHIDQLKREVESMGHALSETQRTLLADPRQLKALKDDPNRRMDSFLVHYIVLRHYVAQYTLQVYAYGPFRTNHDDDAAKIDNDRMERDFGHSSSFMNFLHQVRFGLWSMEDDLIERRVMSRCCQCPEP